MNGRGNLKSKDSRKRRATQTKSARNPQLTHSSALRLMRDERKKLKDREERIELAKKHKAAQNDFKAWKQELIRMISQGSELVYHPDTGKVEFLLPKALSRLCYGIQLKEYMKFRELTEPEAIKAVRADLEEAGDRIEAKRAESMREQAKHTKMHPMTPQKEEPSCGNSSEQTSEPLPSEQGSSLPQSPESSSVSSPEDAGQTTDS